LLKVPKNLSHTELLEHTYECAFRVI